MSDVLGYEIYLPCRLFAVRVEFDDQKGISPIEELFLCALRDGITHIQTLLEIFQLGERPLLDLIYDLWQRSYVSVDVAGRRVFITPGVARQLGSEAEIRQLRGGQHTERSVPLLQDAVVGAIFPVRGARRSPGASAHTVPSALNVLTVTDVRPEEIVVAVEASLGDRQVAIGDRRIVRTHLARGEVTEWGAMRWLPLRVDCTRDPATEQLRFAVLDTGLLDGHSRWRLEAELGRMSDRLATNYFFRQLSEHARPAETPRRLREVLADLVEHLSEDPERGQDRGLVGQTHNRLRELAREARAAQAELTERWAQVTVLAGHESLESHVRAAFRTAKRQVVVACPFVQFEPLNEIYWDVLIDALERGVRVFLLWGIQANAPLDERVRNAFGQLTHEQSLNLFIARRSTRTHAKFVVRDEVEAIIGSYNFLDPSAPGTFELGVSVQGHSLGATSGFVRRLLRWARAAFPDYAVAQGIHCESDGPATSVASGEAQPVIPAHPALSGPGDGQVGDVVERASILVWRRAWQELAGQLAQDAAPVVETAHLIIDGDHPSLLWQALRTASRRLVIVSDRLTTDVVKGRFENALRTLLESDVDVLVVYRRADERVPDGQERPEALLVRLQLQYPKRFTLVRAESHAKVLLFDDRAVVSSFNFLSHEGNYGAGPVLQRRRERSELGVELEGPAVEAVAAALRRQLGDHRALAPLGRASTPPPPLPARRTREPDRATALQPLLTSLLLRPEDREAEGEPLPCDPFPRLTSWFTVAVDAWADLDELAALLGQGDLLRLAAAACFGVRPLGEQPEAEARWRGRLARWAWEEQRYYDAVLLLGSGGGLPEALPRWLPELAIAVGQPGDRALAEVLSHVVAAVPMEAATADAVVALLVQGLLLHGDGDSAEVLDLIEGTCSPLYQALSARARAFFRETGAALNLEDLALLAQARSHGKDQKALASAVLAEINRAEGMRFRFDSGTWTWNHLFHESGLMGQLRKHAQQNDVVAAQRWRVQRLSRYRTVEILLDESTRECGLELIAHKKRLPCIDALRRILDATDRWIDQPVVSRRSLPRLTDDTALRQLAAALVEFGAALGSSPIGLAAAPATALIEATKMMGALV